MHNHHVQLLYHKHDLLIVLVSANKVEVDASKTNIFNTFYGSILPTWVVISSSNRTYALDMQAKQTPIDQVYKTVPKLESFIQANE